MKRISSGFSPLLTVNRKSSTPLHKQIYDAYRTMIVDGRLRPGQLVPSTRALTSELKISRIPLLAAYSQLLSEGYFETRTGAGTFVCSLLPDEMPRLDGPVVRSVRNRPGARRVAQRIRVLPPQERPPWFGLGPFSVSHPAYDEFPFKIWSSLVARHGRSRQAGAYAYGDSLGLPELRDVICGYLTTARGVRCQPHQVMIVSGSQQALEISARVLLDAGVPAWVEEPGYWLTQQVLRLAGCRMIPVPVDTEGLNVSAAVDRQRKARVAYVAPSHQYPLGSTMSASRRLQLLDWAQKSGSWIVEDDYDSEYRYESVPVPSLQGLDANARVIYIGTFSKVLFPSLRIGYLVIPEDLVAYFLLARRTIDIAPPYLQQAVLTDFIREGHFARHIRRMRLLYQERRTALVHALRKQFNSSLEVVGAEAGMHLLLMLPKTCSDLESARGAARQGLWVAPLSSCYLQAPAQQGLILGFGGSRIEEIPQAVGRLARVLRF
jgi:GntR family transcriptional regulator / MocR family aminotransferase